ncbi:MAG: PEP-CTERM sorting domain-containing protein, partial [Rhodanobacteraceae bacterium]
LDTVYVGYTPDGSAPWLMATFDQTGSNTGTLTLTSNLSASDFLQGLNSKKSTIGWAFYLDQSLASLTCSSGTCAGNNALFGGSYNAGPVPGTFNLAFGWSAGNRFVSGSTAAVYDLTFASVLNLDPFVANENGFASVAHVQGITGGCSGWIVSGDGSGANGSGPCDGTPPPHNVPEPADLGMFGIGLLAIGLFLGLRRRMA